MSLKVGNKVRQLPVVLWQVREKSGECQKPAEVNGIIFLSE